jgi:LuxR family maltose regulon positive regulatory protein
VVPASLGLARLKHAQGDRPAALAVLNTPGMNGKPPQGALLPIEVYRSCLLAEAGQRTAAADWLEASGLRNASTKNVTQVMVLLDAAHLMLLLDRPAEADALASSILNSVSLAGWQRIAIQVRVILSKAYTLQGRSTQAVGILEEALRLAEAEGYLRTFLDGGETVHRLAGEVHSRLNPSSSLAGYVHQLLTAFNPLTAPPLKPGMTGELAEPLSNREMEVLRLIVAGLSNQGIAERLVISLTTVKTHIGNIYQKLGVASRTQAIARAEALGLLPRG